MRSVRLSTSVGPPPARAFSIARFASRYTASTSVPSTTTPSKPYASARSATCSVAYSRYVGVEYAHWLLSQTKTVGSLRTPARFIASCASPRADAPSPNQPTATRFSPRMRKASAQPTATGSIAGRWLTIASRPRFASAMWTLPSRPFVGPSERRADVLGAHRRRNAHRGRLVPAAGVEGARDLALLVEDVPALLDPARDQHVAVDGEQVLAVEACLLYFLQRADGLGFTRDRHSLPLGRREPDAPTLTAGQDRPPTGYLSANRRHAARPATPSPSVG